MPYKKMFVMYPPRPEGSAPPDTLGNYPGWWAQRKYNGTRTTVFLSPEGEVHLRTRHREEHKAYQLTDEMREALLSLAAGSYGEWNVYDAELLHSKTTNVKDRIVLFDILVKDGLYLTGTTYEERYTLLIDICGLPLDHEDETGRRIALKVDENVWLAESFDYEDGDEARKLFDEMIDMDEIEGLVLKDPGGKLKPGVTEKNNSEWMIRVRKPHKNYRH